MSFTAVMAVVAISACSESSGDDDDDDVTDPCASKALCATAGVSCDGDVLVTCAEDADGCLVETSDDCGSDGWVCDEATEACVDPGTGCDDAACVGASDGDSFCSGDEAVSCAADGEGCLIATVVDCTTDSQVCDDSGASAACVDPVTCDDDPACAGASEGDLSCDGYALNECTDNDDDGCLELVVTDCSPALCDDSATPVCGTPASGDTCEDAIPVLESGFVLSGTDFTADFADDIVLAGDGCVTRPSGSVDAVFSVQLAAGDTLAVAELGGLDSTRNIQATCGAAEACASSLDDPDAEAITYTAEAAETVYVVVEAYGSSPSTTDYMIAVSINPTCGNGVLEAGEACDDGNDVDDDGCNTSCAPEFGYECDLGSPTVCTEYPFLGSFAAGETIPNTVVTDSVASGVSHYYVIEFTDAVLLSGSLTAGSTGDLDLYIYDADGEVFRDASSGDESWTDVSLAAGRYVIRAYVWSGSSAADTGYTLALATTAAPVCGDGVLEGDEVCDDGDTDPGDGCDASCAVEFGWTCDAASPTVCTSYPSLGSFAAGEAITDVVVTDVLAAGDSDFYLIEFTADVVLAGSLTSAGGGDLDFYLRNDSSTVVSSTAGGDETWSGEAVAAGTYVIEVRAWSLGGDASGYTLAMSTTAP